MEMAQKESDNTEQQQSSSSDDSSGTEENNETLTQTIIHKDRKFTKIQLQEGVKMEDEVKEEKKEEEEVNEKKLQSEEKKEEEGQEKEESLTMSKMTSSASFPGINRDEIHKKVKKNLSKRSQPKMKINATKGSKSKKKEEMKDIIKQW